jgi:hypothetical protein
VPLNIDLPEDFTAGSTGHVEAHEATNTAVNQAAAAVDTLSATVLHRVVEANGVYPTRPATGYADFVGITDPSSVMQTGDTWTQLSATVPSAPTIGTATGGDAQASVAFTVPGWNGGATITGYTATSTPGGITGTGSSSPIVVTGLTNGTTYTFKVKATNSVGTGTESAASNSVTPASATVPGAPTIGTAAAGDASATVAFTPPGSNGGSAITGYTATSSPGAITGTGATSPISVSGLTNGTAYTFTVKATNAVGTGAASAASNSVTPAASGTAVTDTFTGTDGSPWSSSLWASQIPLGLTMDIQSNQGRAVWTAATFEDKARHFALADSANWRCRGLLATLPTTPDWTMTIVIQATAWSADVPSTGYRLSMWPNLYWVSKRENSANTTLTPDIDISGPRWWDFQVIGGVLQYRVWNGLVTDAPAWNTATNSSPITGAGAAGILFSSGATAGTMDFRLDDVMADRNP